MTGVRCRERTECDFCDHLGDLAFNVRLIAIWTALSGWRPRTNGFRAGILMFSSNGITIRYLSGRSCMSVLTLPTGNNKWTQLPAINEEFETILPELS